MEYSQCKLENYLDKLFHKPGFFLEIGCWDGEHISQSVYLEREKGWTGICVDPFPVNFEQRKCVVCSKAISGNGKPREFIKVSIDRRYGGDVSYFSGFRDSVNIHLPLIEEHCDHEVITVETIAIEELYKQYNLPHYIDFLSIDTEGSEIEIISSIDFDTYKFGVIMFEHNNDNRVRLTIAGILERNGYDFFAETDIDNIYIDGGLI